MLSVLRAAMYPLLGLALAGFSFQNGPPPAGSQISLLALNQPPCATLTPTSVVRARLAYRIAAQEQSEHGFEVSIKFATTDPGRTFSLSNAGRARAVQRHDTLTLQYPVTEIWANPQLKHPITCYFYLHRNLGGGRSAVIARTPAVVFQECQ